MAGVNFKGVRQNARDQVNGGNRAIDLSYVDRAGAIKMIGCVLGELTPMGDAGSSTINCELGQSLAFYNANLVTAYVAFASTAAAIPMSIDGSNGVAIPPKQYVVLTAGSNNYFKASSTLCWTYDINDPTRLG